MDASSTPANSAARAMRHTDMPAARITVNSLPRASAPSPTSVPIRELIGSRAQACCGRFSSTKPSASIAV